jgi:anti-sigma factor RsiW
VGCSPFDLRDYFFGELSRDDHKAVDRHVASCAACREELESLRLTQSTLLSVREEEPPRRIAFVSDPVFEPSWWQKLWRSGPALGFASAALLSGAILVHAFVPRNPSMPVPQPQAAVSASAKTISQDEMREIVNAAVAKAVSDSEARQTARFEQVLSKTQRDWELEHRAAWVKVGDYMEMLEKRVNLVLRASNDAPLESAQ